MIKNCNVPQFDNTQVFTVPSDHYFMMGDNRDDSADSRDPRSGVGYVPSENLVGRAEFLFFSTDGYAALWEPWKWPFTVRYGRLFSAIR
jgi:signal peptidase I